MELLRRMGEVGQRLSSPFCPLFESSLDCASRSNDRLLHLLDALIIRPKLLLELGSQLRGEVGCFRRLRAAQS